MMNKSEEIGLVAILRELPPKEEVVLRMRFGVGVDRSHTLWEVGRFLSLMPESISRIQRKAFKKLDPLLVAKIKEFSADRSRYVGPDRLNVELVNIIESITHLEPYVITHLKAKTDDLRKIPWYVFEHLIAEFFASWGYDDVRLVGRDSSTAADIYAVQKVDPSGTRIRYFVEVKLTKARVGIEVIDRVYGAMMREKSRHNWHIGMIVSMAGFKKVKGDQILHPGRSFHGIELRDKNDIVKWLKDYKPGDKGLWLPKPLLKLL